jgi:endonuclease/exonuclease/phosphatase family metal-dependent hydrolase
MKEDRKGGCKFRVGVHVYRRMIPWFCCLLTLFIPLAVSAADAPQKLRVLCWNIHHGEGTDGKLDLQRIATVIRRAQPDLVALQEVDHTTQRTGKVDQTAELARLTGLTGIFGKAMNFSGGAYGQAILSKHPILSNKVHPLPGEGEPRIAFEAIVSIDQFKLKFVSTHLEVSPIPRLAQAKVLAGLFPKQEMPVILCGDFNDSPDSETLGQFKAWKPIPKLGSAFTHPAGQPTDEIDYVFTLAGESLLSTQTSVSILPEPIASDHRPLLVEFVLPPGAPGS